MRKTISVLGILMISSSLVACNTMKGMGKDVESGGEKIQSGASSTQKSMSSDESNKSTTNPEQK
jgi:entericidin B